MLDAAREALGFAAGRCRSDLGRDRMLLLSLIKDLEIVGEAASRVGQPTRDAFPQVPWSKIVGMRNRLIHAYFEINLDRVWDTPTEDLPPLVDQLEAILPREEP